MTENDITLYIVSNYNMKDGHKYCKLQLLRFEKNNQNQNLDFDSNRGNSKIVPDLTKNLHLVKDDKGALKIDLNFTKNEKNEDVKDDKVKKDIHHAILFHYNLKKKHPIGTFTTKLLSSVKKFFFYCILFMMVKILPLEKTQL